MTEVAALIMEELSAHFDFAYGSCNVSYKVVQLNQQLYLNECLIKMIHPAIMLSNISNVDKTVLLRGNIRKRRIQEGK